jgi:tetratricopeptide (TPR) repeat protein
MVALTVAVLVWAWSLVVTDKRAEEAVQAPVRVAYDGSQPLQLSFTTPKADAQRLHAWLQDELESWCLHAPELQCSPVANGAAFSLQIRTQPARATLQLIAPDGFIERQTTIPLPQTDLATATALARAVPQFLGLASSWEPLIGTHDANDYSIVVRAREHLRSRPLDRADGPAPWLVADIDALEEVTRRAPTYARAWSTLALAYVEVQGEDAPSSQTLALRAAERALALDPKAADAHAVRGFVLYRRNQWLAAYEQLEQALQMQQRSALAARGLACLLVDAGLTSKALPIARQAAALNGSNPDAQECLVYALLSSGQPVPAANLPFAAARVVGTVQILEGDVRAARQTIETAAAREHRNASWIGALLDAASDGARSVEALRAVTSAASDNSLDASTEILAGVALRRADFVFNRLLRLQQANKFVPLRVLWLPEVAYLRQHSSFDDVLRASNLGIFWAQLGRPDVCEREPQSVACGQ